MVHVGVTRHPTDAWVAQQLREATPCGRQPRYLLRDHDRTYGHVVTRAAEVRGIDVLRTAHHAPTEHAVCERFLGSVRRACLDHVLVVREAHLRRVRREDVASVNTARPHQGLRQRIPDGAAGRSLRPLTGGTVRAMPVLGGLPHAYVSAA
jgi:putative transposase